MSREVKIRRLDRFETDEENGSIKLFAEETTGRLLALVLPIECISSLIMTLPKMVNAFVQRRRNDPSLRVVYPLAEVGFELSSDRRTRILTLKTPDGFEVAFTVDEQQYRKIKNTDTDSIEVRVRVDN